MNIPRHWIKATGETTRPDGSPIKLTAWGWSASDAADARRNAEDRLSRMMARVESGDALPDRYPYGVRALREEIISEVPRGDDIPAVVVTRNSYGSLVINAPDVMFVDIDAPLPAAKGWLGGLLGGKSGQTGEAWQTIASKLTMASSSSFRIYATAGGFRLLATERTFAPGSGEAEKIMEAVGADPAYVQLCRAQKSFRARLTPKPWRAGLGTPPGQFPRDAGEQAAYQQWLAKYEQKSSDKAVCRYLGAAGGGHVAASITPILHYHDSQTRADSQLSLA
jgi:hypothetical protein